MPHRDDVTDPLEAELAPLLAAEKPAPRPEFVRELDARVAARFPRRKRRSRWTAALWRPQVGIGAAALAAAVIAIVVVTGSGGGGGNANTALLDRAPSVKSAAPSAGAGGSAQSRTESAPSAASAAPNVAPSPQRRVERSTNLVLAVRRGRMQDAAQQVFGIVTAAGGVVQSSNVASGEGAGATFDLRIPASRVTRTVGRLARLGHVRSETNSTLDVTKSYTTLTARLADATAERTGLLRQLAKAVTANQTASIKARLRIVETRINALQRSQRALRNRTDYARVSLELVPQHGAIVAPRHHHRLTPGRALHDAAHVLAVAASVALLALAVALPVAVLALLAWLASRPVMRRRREHALDVA
jgi:Domain of unknown function (DUF4349)